MARRHTLVTTALGCAALLAGLAAAAQGAVVPRVLPEAVRPNTACPVGQVAAEADAAASQGRDGDAGPVCHWPGGPELYTDQVTRAGQLDARQAAPFATVAPGAYTAALAQRAALPGPGSAPGSGAAWQPIGVAPECAGPTTASSACPPASAANGNYPLGPLGIVTESGRITSVAGDPGNPSRVFASPVAGGVYETRDAGATWTSVGDGLVTQVVGAIAYDAPLHLLVVGTGDNSFGGTGISGHGIELSPDDGATWTLASGIPDLALTFKIVVSPVDASGRTLYAATSKGLFRSTDGGASFANLALPTTPSGYSPNCAGDTTTPVCFFASMVTDVVVKPSASAAGPAGAVIAAVGWRAGARGDKNPDGSPNTSCTQNGSATQCLQAPQNGIYLSPTGAPGSFTFQSHPSGPTLGSGFAANRVVGRTALAVATGPGQSSDAVYALVEDAQKFIGCPDLLDQRSPACNPTVTAVGEATVLDGMYASYDYGASWTKIMDWAQLPTLGTGTVLVGQAGYGPGVQAWYNLHVEVDPTRTDPVSHNPTRLIFGLEELWENNLSAPVDPLHNPYPLQLPEQNPGTSPWVVIGRYWNACAGLNVGNVPCNPTLKSGPLPGSTTHPDQHAALFVPDGSGGVTLYAGNDGGVFVQHVAAGADFDNNHWGDGANLGLHTQQPYDAEIAKDGTVVSGLQDNGELKITPDGHMYEVYGGDGFFTTIDPNASTNILEEYTYGTLNMTNDGGTTWNAVSPTDPSDPSGQTSLCSSSTALFSTPIEQDPLTPGHILVGCSKLAETANGYSFTCVDPACTLANGPTWAAPFDLGTYGPAKVQNIPSALSLRGASAYVGYCGYCDVVTGGLPFHSGIATNVGGTSPPKAMAPDGWHLAGASCPACGTPDGKLPQRYITSIQSDPANPSTVYVTLGGYGRRWIPPGALGDDVSRVGTGHVFKSTDHAETFTDITGNLPDVPANWTLIVNGQLVVATDVGVFVSGAAGSGPISSFAAGAPTYGLLGTGLPATPVFTLRASPADPSTVVISTFGRGDWRYVFPASTTSSSTPPGGGTTAGGTTPGGTTSGGSTGGTPAGPITLPNTAPTRAPAVAAVVGVLGVAGLLLAGRGRRRRGAP